MDSRWGPPLGGLGAHGDTAMAAVSLAVERLEHAWFPIEMPYDREVYNFVSLPTSTFVDMLEAAMSVTLGRRFLDVGCGIGTKMLVAAGMGFEVHGIERYDRYMAAARYLVPEGSFEMADARGYTRFGDFDVVYLYRPITSLEGELELEARIVAQMCSGAVLLTQTTTVPGLEIVAPYVWRKP